MKATLSEIKRNPQGTNTEGKEARVQINELGHKEETFNQDSKKKTESKKLRTVYGDSGTTSNVPTFKSQGC